MNVSFGISSGDSKPLKVGVLWS